MFLRQEWLNKHRNKFQKNIKYQQGDVIQTFHYFQQAANEIFLIYIQVPKVHQATKAM